LEEKLVELALESKNYRAKGTTRGTPQDQPDHRKAFTRNGNAENQHINSASPNLDQAPSDAHVLSRGNSALGRVLVPSIVDASCESLLSARTSSKILSSSPASSASRNSIRRRSLRSFSPGSWIPEGSQPRAASLFWKASSRHC
jgi:hypothetical protein